MIYPICSYRFTLIFFQSWFYQYWYLANVFPESHNSLSPLQDFQLLGPFIRLALVRSLREAGWRRWCWCILDMRKPWKIQEIYGNSHENYIDFLFWKWIIPWYLMISLDGLAFFQRTHLISRKASYLKMVQWKWWLMGPIAAALCEFSTFFQAT